MRYISILTLVSVLLLSCTEKESDIPTPKLSFSEQVSAEFESVGLSCSVSGNVSVEKLVIEYSEDPSLTALRKKSFDKNGGSFSVIISGLKTQTTYYYRYVVESKASSFTDKKIRQFKTLDYIAPIVATGDAINISGTKATLGGDIEFSCGKEILEKGFYVGKDKKSLEAKPTTEKEFILSLGDLEFETTYYYQAYAKSEIGTGKGEIKEFKTKNAVSFSDVTVQGITATNILAKGGITDNGGIEIEEQGFRYSEGESAEFVFVESTGESVIASLKPATSYRIWYYAKTFEGEFESEKVEFDTKDGVVLITTSSPENITTTSALLKGLISSDGGSAITERGFCYGQKEMPSVSDTKIKVTGTTGEYQHSLTNLPQNKTYYVRAYAINAIGTYYGDQVSFTTLYDSVIFGTTTCSNVTASSASLKGSITSNGGSTITKCGFCYSTSTNPTVSDPIVEVTDSKTNLLATIKNLKSGMTYHARAFATNANSTFYSNEITFITEDGKVQFAAPELSNIAAESVVASSSIISAGGGTITERGFCYGLTKNPTTSNSTVKASGTSGEYSCTIAGLKNNTVYYIRAYAINESGTFYSAEVTVTTLRGIATVSTSAATNVKALSATINGEIVSDGGSNITERGFCYGTSANPTTNSTVVKINGTIGTITKDLTNLDKATKYYVRAYAINGYGTHYGNEVSFTTSDGIVLFDQLTSSDITVSSFKISTNITSDGDNTITQRGFCYATTASPTISDKKIATSGTTGSLSATISSLTNKTKYYVRAFATNAIGTSYSPEIAIITLSGLPDVETNAVTNVMAQTADVSGNVISANGGVITARGFCYSIAENPTIADSKVSVSGMTGPMSKTISSLTPNTEYHVRAFATTSFGTSYGADKSFKTKNGVVTFSNIAASNVLAVSATLSSDISGDGGSSITERGFCYATSEQPTVLNDKVVFTGDNTSFTVTISNLSRSTVYYFRAYAKNAVGIYYSNQIIVPTQSGIASLSVLSVSNVGQTTADVSCDVVSDGGADIMSRGYCFSTSPNPTLSSQKMIVEGSIGAMDASLSGLISDSDYYVRAFANTKHETSYSNEVVIHTVAGMATLSATSVTEINPTSARFSASLISKGGVSVTNMGFCYSEKKQPTLNDNIVEVQSVELGEYNLMVTGLKQYTRYYVRAFSVTQYGTSYGEVQEFVTSYYPIVFGETKVEAYPTYAYVYGEIEDDGGLTVEEQGICYSTSVEPTIQDNRVLFDDKNANTFPIGMLAPNNKYYARRYVMNRVGVFYGNVVEIQTLSVPDGAVPGVFSVSESKQVWLSKSNLVVCDGVGAFFDNQYDYLGVYEGERTDFFNPKGFQIPSNLADWQVMLSSEWSFLFVTRATNNRFGIVSINDTLCAFVLPDKWVAPPSLSDFRTRFLAKWEEAANPNMGDISLLDYLAMEASGVAFFPYSGMFCYNGSTKKWFHTAHGHSNSNNYVSWGGSDYYMQRDYGYKKLSTGTQATVFMINHCYSKQVFISENTSVSQNSYLGAVRLIKEVQQ